MVQFKEYFISEDTALYAGLLIALAKNCRKLSKNNPKISKGLKEITVFQLLFFFFAQTKNAIFLLLPIEEIRL